MTHFIVLIHDLGCIESMPIHRNEDIFHSDLPIHRELGQYTKFRCHFWGSACKVGAVASWNDVCGWVSQRINAPLLHQPPADEIGSQVNVGKCH